MIRNRPSRSPAEIFSEIVDEMLIAIDEVDCTIDEYVEGLTNMRRVLSDKLVAAEEVRIKRVGKKRERRTDDQ